MGNAAEGDLEGKSVAMSSSAKQVSISIDSEVEADK
jgi:hypothetical protein